MNNRMETPAGIAAPRLHATPCSHCGLCMGDAWPKAAGMKSCVFSTGWLGDHEARLFGRTRRLDDEDEIAFGIARRRTCARMRRPIAGSQWGGIVTAIALRALGSGLVDAVATLHGSMLEPKAALATTPDEVLEGRGNKPVLAPTLLALHEAARKGVRKLLVIGAPCHVHALRDFHARQPFLSGMELLVVGIPCTDNLEAAHLRWVLGLVSRSPGTIECMEFMQDFRVHIRHTGAGTEKLPFFCLPPEVLRPGVFAQSCMCCFDYANGLADLTVGYFGAPFSKDWKLQWLIVRTETGERLLDLLGDDLDFSPETGRGDAGAAARRSLPMTIEALLHPEHLDGRKQMPVAAGNLLCLLSRLRGPKGIEFARYSIHIHAVRNYLHVSRNLPEQLDRLVPEHVRLLAARYGATGITPS